MKKMLISSVLLLATSLFAGDSVSVTGIRAADLNEGSQNLKDIRYINSMPIPGQVEKIPTSYHTAPPMIPHKVKNMLPITIHNNECLACHMPNHAKQLGIHSIPKDHFVDTFENGRKTGSRIAGSRFNCTQCHAPQAQVDPVVQNRFDTIKKYNQ